MLIVRLSALGDCVHVLPSLDALRRALGASAHIAWVVEEKAAPLLRGHPQLDRLHVLPRAAFGSLLALRRPLASLATIATFFRELRRERFDALLDFQSNLRTGLLSLLVRAPLTLGFGRGHCRERSYMLKNRKVYPRSRTLNKVQKNLALVEALGCTTTGARPLVHVPAAARSRMAAFFQEIAGGGPVVTCHPGTSPRGKRQRKDWPAERYAALADRLAAAGRVRVLITWGPGEQLVAEAVRRAARTPPALAPAGLSIQELAALLERSAVVVGGDTGPLHLAAALGAPVVGLYGPKPPAIYGPAPSFPGQPIEVVWRDTLEAIGVEEVETAVSRLLSKTVD